MKKRPPVIAIMGHVDHGKTTLLDYIRKTNVAEKESGGITQSIGAYEIEHDGQKITFIDTPGHEAFSKMRVRGAEVADIAILVVAADDGVKPQTEEALKYIKKVDIPYIVAVNKVDLTTADVEKTLNELSQNEVYLEGRGGDVSYQLISAKKGSGIEDLLDLINLAAEVEDLEYDPDAPGEGVVINSFNDPRKGILVGVIVNNGKINVGDEIFTETAKGKIKSLEDFRGESVDKLFPSSPSLIIGFKDLPKVGQRVKVGEKPEEKERKREKEIKSPGKNEIGVIAKADESGSLEVLEGLIENLSSDDKSLKVVNSGVGTITENDVKLAFSTNSLLVGFGVGLDKTAKSMAKNQKIPVFKSSVIYDLEEDLSEYLKSQISGKRRAIQILDTFGKSGGNQIIGGKVVKGPVNKNESFGVYLKKKKIGEGKIINLKSEKEDIKKAEEGNEVGLMVDSDAEIKKGCILLFGRL